MHNVKYIRCRICGSDEPRFMGFRGNMEYAGARPVEEHRHRVTNVVKCRRCGFVYTNPFLILTEEEKRGMYDDPLDYQPFSSSAFEDSYRFIFRLIHKYKKRGRLLDIGAGRGEFLKFAKGIGWEAYGVEPSDQFSAYAKHQHDVHIHCGDIKDIKLPKNSFDVITLNMVLEHLEDPIGALEEMRTLLKGDGIVFIEVPYVDSLMLKLARVYFLLQGKDWSPILSPLHWPFHSFGYTKKTFRYICQRKNWKLLELRSRSIGYRGFRPEAVERAGKGASILRQLTARAGAIAGMGDIIYVLLRKNRASQKCRP